MKTHIPLSFEQLPVWENPPEAVETLYQNALRSFSHKVIVLDDDPTGTDGTWYSGLYRLVL